jgi:hypothetical protein
LEGGAPIHESVDASGAYSCEYLSARYNPSSKDQNQQNATPCDGVLSTCDPLLKSIIEVWDKLPQSMRVAIQALVTSSIQGDQS